MANSPNFNWELPDDTDLVKDGASAMRTLGNAIDSSLVDLKGGTTGQVLSKASNTDMDFTWVAQDDSNAIQNAIVDAKGDLITATAADTPARLAVGTNNQVLTADSTTATGLKWATPTSGSMTLLSTTSWSSVNKITISSISQAYKHLYIEIQAVSGQQSDGLYFAPNDSTSNTWSGTFRDQTIEFTNGNVGQFDYSGASSNNYMAITIYDYTATTWKPIEGRGGMAGTTANNAVNWGGIIRQTSAISSIAVYWGSTSTVFDAGTIRVYGVN